MFHLYTPVKALENQSFLKHKKVVNFVTKYSKLDQVKFAEDSR